MKRGTSNIMKGAMTFAAGCLISASVIAQQTPSTNPNRPSTTPANPSAPKSTVTNPAPAAPIANPNRPAATTRVELDPAQIRTARLLQARGVSHQLSLSGDEATKLEAAYIASRERQARARDEFMRANNQGTPNANAIRDIDVRERAALEKELSTFLKPDEVKTAIQSLGTYHPDWDRYTFAVSRLNLDEAKQWQALNNVSKFIVDSSSMQTRAGATANGTAAAQRRAALDAEMRQILNDQQITDWTRNTQSMAQNVPNQQLPRTTTPNSPSPDTQRRTTTPNAPSTPNASKAPSTNPR